MLYLIYLTYLIYCGCFEILNNYEQGALHFHLALSHTNYAAIPAVNQEIRVWSQKNNTLITY